MSDLITKVDLKKICRRQKSGKNFPGVKEFWQIKIFICEQALKCFRMGITIFKIFIWGIISSDIQSEITFQTKFLTYNIQQYTSPNERFEYSYPLNGLQEGSHFLPTMLHRCRWTKILSLKLQIFSYPSVLANVLGAILLSTHNIYFGWEIRKLISLYTLLTWVFSFSTY